MGNFHSAHIDCVIDKQTDLEDGEPLTGHVTLKVHDAFSFQKHFNGITLIVAGIEYALIKGREEDETDVVMPTSKVVKVKSVVELPSRDKGEHSIPFAIDLPTPEHHAAHYRKSLSSGDSVWSSVVDGSSSSDSTPMLAPTSIDREGSEGDMSDTSDLSVSPLIQKKMFVMDDGVPKTVVYHVKAILKRRKGVALNVDTDIKCHAKCAAVPMAL